ncbi:uncharacterized protein C8A04DRAFT_29801 [Dichotomopilus funicola]|uniref:Uncharacterized protein n=1 Tax=Dichotomopilus funicola TaxID=1934379 RepID=A0AAN6V0E5_9PEZI|nr:hypothetical protein C8A04DRAFT_29801 [Dichotomopilus funicola]
MRFLSPFTTCLVQALLASQAQAIAIVTPPPPLPTRDPESQHQHQHHDARALVETSTCGYSNGDPAHPLTAPAGYNCRVDTARGVWGFCPATVGADVQKCDLPVYCFDQLGCETGCGDPKVTGSGKVLACNQGANRFCSVAALIVGTSSQTFFTFGCAISQMADEYYVTPTAPLTTTSETPQVSTAKPSVIRSSQSPGRNPDATPGSPTPLPSNPSPSSTGSPRPSTATSSRQSPSNPLTNPSKTTAAISTSYPNSSTQSNNPFTTTAPSDTPNPQTTPNIDNTDNTPENSPNIPALVGGTLGGLALILSSVIAYLCLRQRRLFAFHSKPPNPDGAGGPGQTKNPTAAMLETVELRRELEDTGIGAGRREVGELPGNYERAVELGPGRTKSELPAERYSRGMEMEVGRGVERETRREIGRWSWEDGGGRCNKGRGSKGTEGTDGLRWVGRYLS